MNDDPKLIDLPPHKWKSDREKPREPIFGPGLPEALATLIGFIVVFSVVQYFR